MSTVICHNEASHDTFMSEEDVEEFENDIFRQGQSNTDLELYKMWCDIYPDHLYEIFYQFIDDTQEYDKIVPYFTSRGIDYNRSCDLFKGSIVAYACGSRNNKLLKALVQNGGNVNTLNNDGTGMRDDKISCLEILLWGHSLQSLSDTKGVERCLRILVVHNVVNEIDEMTINEVCGLYKRKSTYIAKFLTKTKILNPEHWT